MPVVIEHDGKEHSYQLGHHGQRRRPKLLNLDPRDHPEVMEVLSGTPADKGRD